MRELVKAHGQPQLSFDDFQAHVLPKTNGHALKHSGGSATDAEGKQAEEFIQGFQVFDKDSNGLISSGELRYGTQIRVDLGVTLGLYGN